MSALPLSVETFEEAREKQDISEFSLTGQEVVNILAMYDPYGVWRLDINTGLVYWSDDVFLIHGLDIVSGPVNLNDAINAYHPEDGRVIGQLLEECIANKSGFRFVLRLKKPEGGYKLVKSIGRYRENSDGDREVVGVFSQFALPIRSIAAVN